MAANDETEVHFYCNNMEKTVTINEGEHIYRELGMLDHSAIYSDKEILATQHVWSNYPDDPAMVLVPPTIFYSNQILSSTVSGYQEYMYATVYTFSDFNCVGWAFQCCNDILTVEEIFSH